MGTEVQQQFAVAALGYSNSESYDVLMEELAGMMEDSLTDRARVSADSGGLYNILSSAVRPHQGLQCQQRNEYPIKLANIRTLVNFTRSQGGD